MLRLVLLISQYMKPRFVDRIRRQFAKTKYKHLLNCTLRPGRQSFPNFEADSYHVGVCIGELVPGGSMYLLLENRYAARLVSAAVSFQNGRRLQ